MQASDGQKQQDMNFALQELEKRALRHVDWNDPYQVKELVMDLLLVLQKG